MIPRLFIIESRFYSREYAKSSGLDRFLTGIGSLPRTIERYKLIFHGLLVQEEGSGVLHLVRDDKIVFVKSYTEYCRWHNGPLEERDNPLEREYCLREAVGELGYCRIHRDTLRAHYTRCFGSSSIGSLESCRILDEKLKDRVEYVVYLLAYNHNRFKVGSTRMWRLYERLGEQPHIAATILYTSRSALKTREVEIKAGRLEWLTERPRRNLREVLSIPPGNVVNRLAKIAEKTRRVLNLPEITQDRIIRIEPAYGIEEYYRAREERLEPLYGKPLLLRDYYAGYMLLEEPNSNSRYIVKASRILHTGSIKLVR